MNSATYATNAFLKGVVFSGFRFASVDTASAISAIYTSSTKCNNDLEESSGRGEQLIVIVPIVIVPLGFRSHERGNFAHATAAKTTKTASNLQSLPCAS